MKAVRRKPRRGETKEVVFPWSRPLAKRDDFVTGEFDPETNKFTQVDFPEDELTEEAADSMPSISEVQQAVMAQKIDAAVQEGIAKGLAAVREQMEKDAAAKTPAAVVDAIERPAPGTATDEKKDAKPAPQKK